MFCGDWLLFRCPCILWLFCWWLINHCVPGLCARWLECRNWVSHRLCIWACFRRIWSNTRFRSLFGSSLLTRDPTFDDKHHNRKQIDFRTHISRFCRFIIWIGEFNQSSGVFTAGHKGYYLFHFYGWVSQFMSGQPHAHNTNLKMMGLEPIGEAPWLSWNTYVTVSYQRFVIF